MMHSVEEILMLEGVECPPDTASKIGNLVGLYLGYKSAYVNTATLAAERFDRMSSIYDIFREMRSRQCSLIPNRQVAVIHIPKTGGTSLRQNLKLAFPNAVLVDMGGEVVRRTESREFHFYDVIFGHMGFDDIWEKCPEIFTVAFVRHPVSLALSRWAWLRSYADDPVFGKQPTVIAASGHDFSSYVHSADYEVYEKGSNPQSFSLMGKLIIDKERTLAANRRVFKPLDEKSMVEIVSRLQKIGFLGIFENLDSEATELMRKLGAADYSCSARLNVGRDPQLTQLLTPDVEAKIIERNALDMFLYQEAQRLRRLRTSNAVL